MAEDFNPEEHTAPEVVEHLEDASDEEKKAVGAAELQGKGRKTVLEAAGVDPNARMDASGRVLNPWEVDPPKADAEAEN